MISPWVALAGMVAAAVPFSVPTALVPAAPAPGPELAAVADSARTEQLKVNVLARFPHDTEAFTQGLEWYDGMLYEGTGQYGESELRIVEPMSGQVRDRVALPESAFGEGITLVGNQIWQLTWMEEYAFLRDRATLAETKRVNYSGQGWGVCHDAPHDRLVMSDGSDQLTFRDPVSFEKRRTVGVTLDGEPLTQLNELECVGTEASTDVWANVWQSDQIVRIDPATGTVEAVVDASGLLSESEAAEADVLNGVAAIPGTNLFLITGKLWPWTFLVEFE